MIKKFKVGDKVNLSNPCIFNYSRGPYTITKISKKHGYDIQYIIMDDDGDYYPWLLFEIQIELTKEFRRKKIINELI